MSRLLGVELTPDELRLALVERRLGGTRLVACARAACTTTAERRAALAPMLARRPHAIVAALPLAELAHRVLALPFRDPRRIAETVPLELLGQLPADPGDVAAGHLPLDVGADGARVLAAIARRGRVDTLRATLAQAGAVPARVDAALVGVVHLLDGADAALVLADGGRSAVVVRRRGRVAGLRALGAAPRDDAGAFAREVAWTTRALGGADRLVLLGADATAALAETLGRATGLAAVPLAEAVDARWRADGLLACAVAAGLVSGPGLTLHEAGERAARPRRVAGLAAAVLLLAAGNVALERWHLARRDAALVAAVRETAAAALPPGTRVVAPRAQLEAADGALAGRAGTAGDVLALLRELSTRVPPDVRATLDALTLEGDVVRVHGRTDRFESIDLVTRALAASTMLRDVAAEDSRAAVDGNGVEFGVRATWRPAAGAPS